MRKLRIPDNLTTMAYRSIRNHILEGGLEKDGRLTEERLAKSLGISKSPIREALTKLESEGLIRIEPRRGAYLRELTLREIQDLFEMREALEAHVVLTLPITQPLLKTLGDSIERLGSYRRRGEKAQCIEEDMRFHVLLAEATGNAMLRTTLESIQRRLWLSLRKTYDIAEPSAAVSAHTAIVDALAAGNRRRAEKLMRAHVAQVRTWLVDIVNGENSAQKHSAAAGA